MKMKRLMWLVCLLVGMQSGRAAVGVIISPEATPLDMEGAKILVPEVDKVWWRGQYGRDYILVTKPALATRYTWDTYSFVTGAGDPTRRSVFNDKQQSYFVALEMPTVAVGSNVHWRFTLADEVTGGPLASNTVLQCTGRVYFTEKPNVMITGTNWFSAITHTYSTPGRKEVRIDVETPGGGYAHREWAVLVTNTFVNSLINEGFESGPSNAATGWIKGGHGNNSRVHSIVAGRTGQRAAQVTMSNCFDGDVRWQPVHTNVVAGGRYRFSFWYLSSVSNNVTIECLLSNGTTRYIGLALPPPAADWTYREYILVMPSNVVTASPYVALTTNGVLTMDDVKLVKLSHRSSLDRALITFYNDDGMKIPGTNVAGISEKYGFRTSFAIPSSRVGIAGQFTWAELRDLESRGHEIVAHTMTHSDLTNLAMVNGNQFIREINLPRMIFRTNGLREPFAIVPPFGSRNAEEDAEVLDAGYGCQVSTLSGFNEYGNYNPFALKRMTIYSYTTVAEVKAWIDEASAKKLWLIIAWHHVGDGDTSTMSWPKAWVEEVVAYAQFKAVQGVSTEEGFMQISL
jgi:peptidoglycan/xylan/chitin deacetylase (PgdA/CDA1 family)